MQIAGQANLDVRREDVWPLIFDPRSLLELLPGCDQVEQVAPDEYHARMNLRVPAVAGAYAARVKVIASDAPRFCRISGEADGPAGRVQGEASFTLTPQEGQTRIEYQGDALITGPLAGMNPRFAEGIAQTLINQGLTKLPVLVRSRIAANAQSETTSSRPHVVVAARIWSRARFVTRIRAWFVRLFARFVDKLQDSDR